MTPKQATTVTVQIQDKALAPPEGQVAFKLYGMGRITLNSASDGIRLRSWHVLVSVCLCYNLSKLYSTVMIVNMVVNKYEPLGAE